MRQHIFFGTGCFWCTEALFSQLKGVTGTMPGFMGGQDLQVSYEDVCKKDTGHAEVLRIEYDPQQIDLHDLLSFFWRSHDPTSLNRQGDDVGPQYRSCIFCADQETLASVIKEKAQIDASGLFDRPLVTEVLIETPFVPAPEHKDYFLKNPDKAYCQAVIAPKVRLLQRFLDNVNAQKRSEASV